MNIAFFFFTLLLSTLTIHANTSPWEQDTFLASADIIIVGSGIVGVSSAIEIKEARPNWRVLVIEKGILPSGASTKNAGFACVGSISEIAHDLKQQPFDAVTSLIRERWQGLQLLRKRVGDGNLDYQNCNGYELFEKKDITDYSALIAKLNGSLRAEFPKGLYHDYPQKLIEVNTTTFKHCIINPYEGALHPGKMMRTLIRKAREIGIEFLFGCEVKSWELSSKSVQVQSTIGKLRGAQLLITTNGFAKQLIPELELKPARNQVLITEPIPDLNWIGTFHCDQGYIYFRNVKNRLLLGGARNIDPNEEETTQFNPNEKIKNHLTNFLNTKLFPNRNIQIQQWWSGIMGVGTSKSPIIKRLNNKTTIAVRLGGMGVALGSMVGKQASELVIHN